MKRYLSMFEMIARSSIYKVLFVISGMILAEAVCFYFSMQNASGRNFTEYIDQSQYSLIFKIAYILITIVIVLPGMNLGSTQSYTLQRLRIKENRIYWLQAMYNFLTYVLLWGTQLVMILASALVFQKNLPKGITWGNQTLFLEFYRSAFMHSILPLEDGPSWWILALIGVVTALAAAKFTKLQREGKFGGELIVIVIAVLIAFPRALGNDITFIAILMCVVCMVMAFGWAVRKLGGE